MHYIVQIDIHVSFKELYVDLLNKIIYALYINIF